LRLYVPLTEAEWERLRTLAWAERRSARDHAALLLAKALGFEQIGAPATDRAQSTLPSCALTSAQGEEETAS
jgi:hypothetical protein